MDLIRKSHKEDDLIELLKTGTCGLHTVYGSFKHGIKQCCWDLDKVLSSKWKILDQSSSGKADYKNH